MNLPAIAGYIAKRLWPPRTLPGWDSRWRCAGGFDCNQPRCTRTRSRAAACAWQTARRGLERRFSIHFNDSPWL